MSASDHLSDAQLGRFVRQVHKTGGATMDLRSGRLLQPGQRGYLVGGEPDRHGRRIPTSYVPASDFGPHHVRAAVESLRHATGNRARTNLGAWVDEGHVELDASARTRRAGEAVRKGRARSEKEVWDNRRMRGVDTRKGTDA